MKSILVTGCNRGLGLGIIKRLIKESNVPQKILATCRNLEKATELRSIATSNQNVHILKLDVRHSESFEAFSEDVGKIVGEDGLNVLFNNAGYSPKSTRINMLKTEQLMETFLVNTAGPIMLTKALLPLLKRAAEKNSYEPMSCNRSAVINMSSILGSIGGNDNGGLYPYRCSKVALNMATKSLSIDLKKDNILVTCLHPGWVKTEMGGPGAPMEINDSVSGIVTLLKCLSEEHNGGFYQWDGKKLDW